MNLPEHLKAKVDVSDIRTEITQRPEVAMTPELINKAFETLGLTAISGEKMRALRELGVAAKQQGILETMQGSVMVTQQHILDVLAELRAMLIDQSTTPKMKLEIGKAIGYLGGQLSKVQGTALKSEHRVVEQTIAQDRQRRSSFPKGPVIDVTPVSAPVSQ